VTGGHSSLPHRFLKGLLASLPKPSPLACSTRFLSSLGPFVSEVAAQEVLTSLALANVMQVRFGTRGVSHSSLSLTFNPVHFIQPNITILTHTTSVTFDLTSDQAKTPKEIEGKKTFTEEKSEETFRRATEEDPSIRMDRSNQQGRGRRHRTQAGPMDPTRHSGINVDADSP